jgi:hypothetical protein
MLAKATANQLSTAKPIAGPFSVGRESFIGWQISVVSPTHRFRFFLRVAVGYDLFSVRAKYGVLGIVTLTDRRVGPRKAIVKVKRLANQTSRANGHRFRFFGSHRFD